MQGDNFYLGTHHPDWLEYAEFPLFVSRRSLERYKTLPRASCHWSLDSSAFTELSMYGRWNMSFSKYISFARRCRDEIGMMNWAAPMDWMCESFILQKTGGTVKAHQKRTVRNYLALMEAAPDIPWIPVLQGWTLSDYKRCIDLYSLYRVDLTKAATVGIGSVCRRQGEVDIAILLHELASYGINLHAFGLKLRGLTLTGDILHSADSMAWSFDARRKPVQCGSTTHKHCGNCYIYAKEWRSRAISLIERVSRAEMFPMPPDICANQPKGSILS